MVSRLRADLLIGLTETPSYTQAELSRWNRWLGSGGSRKSSSSRYSSSRLEVFGRSSSCLSTPPTRASASRSAGGAAATSGQPVGGRLADQFVERAVQRGPEAGGGGQLLLQELARAGLVDRLRQQVVEQVDGDALGPQLLDERVVLLARPLGPHDVVEEQVVDVLRGEAGEFETGLVHDHLVQPADLGVDVEAHGVLLFSAGAQRRQAGTGAGSDIDVRCRR